MSKTNLIALALFTLALVPLNVFAQEYEQDRYNPRSVRPVRADDQMVNKTLWYRLDLREKQSQPFFASEKELTKLIMNAVRGKLLRPYESDELLTVMDPGTFDEKILLPTGDGSGMAIDDSPFVSETFSPFPDSDPFASATFGPEMAETAAADEFLPEQLYRVELREDWIFDKKRSQLVRDIQAITLYIPGEQNPTGLDEPIASFSYKDLVEIVFRENPEAFAYNDRNEAGHQDYSTAFDLRLFAANLIKESNATDRFISDVYGMGKSALSAAQAREHALMATETGYWSN